MTTTEMFEVPVEEAPTREPVILKGRVEAYVEFELNLTELQEFMEKNKPGSWADYALEPGYQEWERGSVIAWDAICDGLDIYLAGVGITQKWTDVDEVRFNTNWTPELAEQLSLIPKDDAVEPDAVEAAT